MEANPIHHKLKRQVTTIWTPEIYGLGDHLFDCFCWHVSTLVKLVFFWERGVTLMQACSYPSIEGITPHLPIGDHHRLRPEAFTSVAWPDLKHWSSIGQALVKYWLFLTYLAVQAPYQVLLILQ